MAKTVNKGNSIWQLVYKYSRVINNSNNNTNINKATTKNIKFLNHLRRFFMILFHLKAIFSQSNRCNQANACHLRLYSDRWHFSATIANVRLANGTISTAFCSFFVLSAAATTTSSINIRPKNMKVNLKINCVAVYTHQPTH